MVIPWKEMGIARRWGVPEFGGGKGGASSGSGVIQW